MALYRKKPMVVEANQTQEPKYIETLEGTMYAQPGDYIVKGIHGDIYPVKESIFLATYELVEEKNND
jgi:hypothetical protein